MKRPSIPQVVSLVRSVQSSARRLVLVVAVPAVVFASTGCATVAPYERAKLAHPTMTASDLATMGAQHLRAISEGATGGSAGAGSGCGCN